MGRAAPSSCGARFDLPGIGRFLTPDPTGHEGGPNLYAYCANDPVNQIDPDGKQPQVGALLAFGRWVADFPTMRTYASADELAIYAGNYFYDIGRNGSPRREWGGWIAKRKGRYEMATIERADAKTGFQINPSSVRASYEGFWHIHPFDALERVSVPGGGYFEVGDPTIFSGWRSGATTGDLVWARANRMDIYMTRNGVTRKYDCRNDTDSIIWPRPKS